MELWDKIRKDGYDTWFDNKELKDNPYPESEDVNSNHIAWRVGWLEADNESYDVNAYYYL